MARGKASDNCALVQNELYCIQLVVSPLPSTAPPFGGNDVQAVAYAETSRTLRPTPRHDFIHFEKIIANLGRILC
jgi:hypothetical protein